MKPLRILILEDNPFDAKLILRELKKSKLQFVSKEVSDKPDYITAFAEFKPDVILSDHNLPSIHSEEALAIAKKKCSESVFILITGAVSEEFAVKILQAGADDYILKSSLTRLPSAIINAFDKKQAEKERELNFIKFREANEELKTFIYRASHDLRSPVCSIRGLINITKINTEKTELITLIEMMDKCAVKMDNILMELITTVSMRNKKIEKTKIDLVPLIHEIIEQLKFINGFERTNLNISNSNNCSFYSEKDLMVSILQNVIKNSIMYHNHSVSKPFVNIDITSADEDTKIVVTDNGMGIKKELLGRVFEMFFKANYVSDGTGLGLYLVKIAVEKLGGNIKIESEEDKGTTVIIFLPASAKKV